MLLLLLSACRSVDSSAAIAPIVRPSTPGSTTTPVTVDGATPLAWGNAGIPAFGHIFVIVLENADYQQVAQAGAMPYLAQLGATYSVATHYYAISHPSLPNYLALLGGSTFDIHSDCVTCSVSAPNLVDQLEQQGKSWKAFMEGLPAACSPVPEWPFGHYAKKHNPFLYFSDIRDDPRRCQNVVPYSVFSPNLVSGAVPDFVWITPDLCHDGHDCSLAESDRWLSSTLPPILNSAAFKQGGALLIIFDEGANGTTEGCCHLAQGGHVYTLVASPLARAGAQINVPYDHYSLLRTIEDAWKLPHLGGAADPATTNMAAVFRPAP